MKGKEGGHSFVPLQPSFNEKKNLLFIVYVGCCIKFTLEKKGLPTRKKSFKVTDGVPCLQRPGWWWCRLSVPKYSALTKEAVPWFTEAWKAHFRTVVHWLLIDVYS